MISFTSMKQVKEILEMKEKQELDEFTRCKIISDLTSMIVVETKDFGEQGVCVDKEATVEINDRTFLLTESCWYDSVGSTFSVFESLPFGLVNLGGVDIELLDVYKRSPSSFSSWCEENDVCTESISMLRRYPNDLKHIPLTYLSHDEAIQAVLTAVEQDCALVGFRKIAEFDLSSSLTEQQKRFWNMLVARLELERWESALIEHNLPPSLFDDKVDFGGQSIPESSKKAILGFLNKPTLDNWKVAGECPISPTSTLYQAIYVPNSQICINFKPDYTKPVPTVEEVEVAMLVAVARHNEKCRAMIGKLKEQLKSIDNSGSDVD